MHTDTGAMTAVWAREVYESSPNPGAKPTASKHSRDA